MAKCTIVKLLADCGQAASELQASLFADPAERRVHAENLSVYGADKVLTSAQP